jgi:aspartate kinase
VFTADPRYVSGARLIERLDYETALELAALGSKVLHSRCVEVGAKHLVPIVVRNSFGTDENRKTVIMSFNDQTALEAPVVSGITLDQNIARLTVQGTPADGQTLSKVFGVVAEKGINVDIIVQNKNAEDSPGRFGFTVAGDDLKTAVEAVNSLKNQPGFEDLSVTTQRDLAKVSAVGLGMRSHSGVAKRVFDTLTTHGIDIQMISTSEIKISCVVAQADGKNAVQILHDTFFGG